MYDKSAKQPRYIIIKYLQKVYKIPLSILLVP